MPWKAKRYDWFVHKFFYGSEEDRTGCPRASVWDQRFIDEQIEFLPVRERFVLQCRLRGLTLNEVRQTLNITPERVRQLEAKAFRRFRGSAGRTGQAKIPGRRRFYWWHRRWQEELSRRHQEEQQPLTTWGGSDEQEGGPRIVSAPGNESGDQTVGAS